MHSGEDRASQVMYSEIPRKNGDQAAGDCQQSLTLYPALLRQGAGTGVGAGPGPLEVVAA